MDLHFIHGHFKEPSSISVLKLVSRLSAGPAGPACVEVNQLNKLAESSQDREHSGLVL
jgi:hypothetical protein